MIQKHLEEKGVKSAPKAVKIASPKKGEADTVEVTEAPIVALKPSEANAETESPTNMNISDNTPITSTNSAMEVAVVKDEVSAVTPTEEPKEEVDEEARKKVLSHRRISLMTYE